MAAVDDLLADGRALTPLDDGVLTALPGGADTSYDRMAPVYDRVIPNRLYSRVFWNTRPSDYVGFAREALAAGEGPMLDAAGGTGVFTADLYRATDRRVVFCDLSQQMLARARRRIGAAVTLVQADATDPPFRPGAFETVAVMSAMHVFPDPAPVVRALSPLVADGGRMYLSGLVAETPIGSRYLRFLHRTGEAGPPRTEAELVRVVEEASGRAVRARRAGAMSYLVAQ